MDSPTAQVEGKQEIRHVFESLLPAALCRELALIHRVCAVPGYRQGCTSSSLAASPAWAWPAILRAREIARDAAEDTLDEFGGLWPETTVTVAWLPGSDLPVHSDDCQDYLAKRHVSLVVWLSTHGQDFDGGEFFFEGGREDVADAIGEDGSRLLRPRAGRAVLFDASERHGLKGVRLGERLALNIWFTREPAAAEDARLLTMLPPPLRLLSACERLHGRGPQCAWPPGGDASRLARLGPALGAKAGAVGKRCQVIRPPSFRPRASAARRLLAALGSGTNGFTPRSVQQSTCEGKAAPCIAGGASSSGLSCSAFRPLRRADAAIAAFKLFVEASRRAQGPRRRASCGRMGLSAAARDFAACVKAREHSVLAAYSDWQGSSLLTAPPLKPMRAPGLAAVPRPQKRRRLSDSAHSIEGDAAVSVDHLTTVPGLSVARSFLCARTRKAVELALESSVLPHVDSPCDAGDVSPSSAPNQAMRFGDDVPRWARRLALRCARLRGLLSAEVATRRPCFDQMIVNVYHPGQGICRHIDLLKFDDGIVGVCLGDASATLTLRRLRDGAKVDSGDECGIPEHDFDGERVDIEVHPGDVYALCGGARYRWTHEIEASSLRHGKRRISLTFRKLLPSAWQLG